MYGRPRLGKAEGSFLETVVYRFLGSSQRQVIVGPSFGVDNSVLKLNRRRVLVSTADPLSYLPYLGPESSAWLSVHLLASDLTTSGFPPQFGLFVFNLPPSLNDTDFAKYWNTFHKEWKRLGLAIIGGHTGRYPGIDFTIIGGGFVTATGPSNRYLTSAMAKDGDDVLLTKGAAIETTAILARTFPRKVKKAIGGKLFEDAWNYLSKVTTVEEALAASSLGVRENGVTAMHDATEGGVIAALIELADASTLGLSIDVDAIRVSEETREICKMFNIDPLISISEGSLIIASRPWKTDDILSKLRAHGIPSHVIGKLTSKFRGCRGTSTKGTRRVSYPQTDPYWKAYAKAKQKHWS